MQGVQIDAVTGAWVAAQQVVHCDRFATRFNVRSGAAARLLLRDFGDLSTGVPVSHLPVAAPQRTVSTSHGPNTLIVYCEEAWDSEIIPTLRAGLERCGRDDCGLVLLVLLREGLLDSIESSPVRQVAEFAGEFGIAAIVNEDVGSAWSTMLGLKDDAEVQSWRLLSPAGGVTWMHSGRIGGDGLASALDQCLLPSPAPTLERIRGTTLDVGDRAPVVGLHSGIAATGAAHCPPLPLGRLGKGSVVAFVRGDSRASEALLEELAARHPQDGDQSPFVVAVVVGVRVHEMRSIERARLVSDFPLLGDAADGTITDRFGISIWPTTLTLDQTARVVATETSNDSEPRRWDLTNGGDDMNGPLLVLVPLLVLPVVLLVSFVGCVGDEPELRQEAADAKQNATVAQQKADAAAAQQAAEQAAKIASKYENVVLAEPDPRELLAASAIRSRPLRPTARLTHQRTARTTIRGAFHSACPVFSHSAASQMTKPCSLTASTDSSRFRTTCWSTRRRASPSKPGCDP